MYFNAASQGESIVLQWETAFEIDFAGFQLWRSANGLRGDAQLISTNLIAGRGTAGTGAAYTFTDTDVRYNVQYTYWLREVNMAGVGDDIRTTSAMLTYALYVPYVGR